MRKLRIGFGWQGGFDVRNAVEEIKVADDSGVDAAFNAEAWGRDAFTMLAILGYETNNIKLGTSIVNIYSRTPAALAQHFGTLDELTGGRMIIGLGTTSANVTDHFHGVKFGKPLARMREYVEIINTLIADEPLHHDGEYFKGMERGFTLRGMNLPRKHIPIHIASITPKSQQQTAEIADGWFPIFAPREQWDTQVKPFQDAVKAAGRNIEDVPINSAAAVRVTDDVEGGYRSRASGAAFYIARMGDFYYEHFVRMGYADEANAVRLAWREGGADAAIEVLPKELVEQLGVAGSVDECIEWMEAAEDAGYATHSVSVDEQDPKKRAEIFRKLVG
jgi:F420-dependent oxidoreductase-like protein